MNEDINFEDAMKQLESIANELEKGNLTLDESVKNSKKVWICLKNVTTFWIQQKRRLQCWLTKVEKLKKIILYQRKTNCNYIMTRISAKRKEHNKSE